MAKRQSMLSSFFKLGPPEKKNKTSDNQSIDSEPQPAQPVSMSNITDCPSTSMCLSDSFPINAENTLNKFDIGQYVNKPIDEIVKQKLLIDPWVPDENFKFPVSEKRNLKFQLSWLKKYNWLTYSQCNGQGALCKMCVLFGSDSGVGKGQNQKLMSFVTLPFRNWKKALEKFTEHSQNKYHSENVVKADYFLSTYSKQKLDIRNIMDTSRQKSIVDNRKRLSAIIDVIKLCGRQELALRGTNDFGSLQFDQTEPTINDGNFRAILRMRISHDSSDLGFMLVSCLGYDEERRQRGELRKACSSRGHPIQPLARVNTTLRLIELRELMKSETTLGTEPIQGYIITATDEHQSEDIDNYEKRRQYISGFSGTWGDGVVTLNKAALWTDGRFHLQADEQINCDWLLMRVGHRNIPTMAQWLKGQFPLGARIGVNPKLISEFRWNTLQNEFAGTDLKLIALNVSLIDVIWPTSERGQRLSKDAFIWDIKYAGKNYTTKIEETRKELRKLGADAMVVTSLDEVSWLLNIKGRDVPYSPFVRSYVILDMKEVTLYVNASQLVKKNVMKYLHYEVAFSSYTVIIRNYDDIWKDLRTKSPSYNKILVPYHCGVNEGASHAIYSHILPDRRLPRVSPIIYLKAVKNPTEIKGMEIAHIRDAAAVCDCLAYIEKQSSSRTFTELMLVELLNEYRFEQNLSLGNSFRTIAAFGPNAAMPHYEPTKNTDATIFGNSTLVLDSGGQYCDGTTDVSRTVHLGIPTEDQKEAYTRVLVGLIQLETLTFPSNMKMADADANARAPLWDIGLDYGHGTGHGVGAFGNVHEAPLILDYNVRESMVERFKPGYFLSNEPGFYREGDFGVRLENVVQVVDKPWLRHTSGHGFLGFKVMTLVPFEPKLMKLSLLSAQHRRWLNSYSEKIRNLVGAELKKQKRMHGFYWMMDKTKHIPESSAKMITSHHCIVLVTNYLFIQIFIL